MKCRLTPQKNNLKNQYSNAVIFIGPFKISTDNYHAVIDSALCVYKTARVVGSRRVTRTWKQQNASRTPRRAVSRTLLELFVYLIANG